MPISNETLKAMIRDFQDRQIRLPEERLAHILQEHPEMAGMEWTISQTLKHPEHIRYSASDPETVTLYYKL